VASKKRKKLRVAFRKNRQKRGRARNYLPEDLDDRQLDKAGEERLSGKGELTRRRTVVGTELDGGEVLRAVDESRCLLGRVVAAAGLHSLVEAADGRRYECTVRRVLRTMAREARNAVVAGDRVLFLPTDDEHGVIERVEPRQGTLSREVAGKEHVIVSNVDQVLIVVSADKPPLKTNLVDRLLVSAHRGGVKPLVCINKIDLVDPAALEPVAGMYGRLGYEVVLSSAARGWGIDRLRTLLADRQTVTAGQSGVGKSSLLNRVQPDLFLETGEVSSWTRKGRHTTRRAVLLRLDRGGWVVDTPGIRQLQLWNVPPLEVEAHFVEFRPFVARCRFPDCTHYHEADCAVKGAVERDLIAQARYASYLKILTGSAD